ncbi:MAG: hypothetical protein JWQ11_411 [Rhizobacter sp.]|nr:hypothetical protein [Rhizobacter sp.]
MQYPTFINPPARPSATGPVDRFIEAMFSAMSIVLFIGCLALVATTARAATPAGSIIGNQASATYSDPSAVTRTVTSNQVVTTVRQVSSLTLTASGAKTISPAGQVYYPQTLTNTGNGVDTFALSSTGTGTLTFASTAFYNDTNGDGVPDDNTPITTTPALVAGQVFKFVVAGIAPATATTGQVNTMVVTATGTVALGSQAASVTDVTTITNNGVINVTQSLSQISGASPSTGQLTLTLTYTNTGNTPATNVTIGELLPSGMTYVAGTGVWSGTASALTDATGDNQSGITYDANNAPTPRQVNAVIASVPAGSSGTVSFKVLVNTGLPAGANVATQTTATYAYNDGSAAIAASPTNTLQYTVVQGATVSITGATIASATQGSTVDFTNVVTNGGNGADSFDLTIASNSFPAGTTFQLFRVAAGGGAGSPLTDSNGNSIPDTGPVAAGGTFSVIVRASLPTASTGGPYTASVLATSRLDTTKTATGTDTLTAITASTTDLTNDTSGGPGVGAYVMGSAATQTRTVDAGGTVRFTLVTKNSGTTSDLYALLTSADQAFASTLPAGWVVVFRDSVTNAVVTNTGVIAAGGAVTTYADVTVPVGASSSDVFFKVLSPATGSNDIVRDAVSVNSARSVTVTPSQSGQVTAGGTVVYTHMVTNTGNLLEGAVAGTSALTVADTGTGFTSIIYWDKNNDGLLDPNDPIVAGLSDLTGGTNGANTVAGLAAGASARLFVKVSAPAGSATGITDTATLRIAMSGALGGIGAPTASVAIDNTTVVASSLTLITMQAIDAACDGTADTAFSTAPISPNVAIGQCIRYQVTATNAGPQTITAVVITDTTPVFTAYSVAAANAGVAAVTGGTVTSTPINGSAGAIVVTVTSLAPNGTAVLTFGVQVQQ